MQTPAFNGIGKFISLFLTAHRLILFWSRFNPLVLEMDI